MKTAFIIVASTPTITTMPTAPQQQVVTSPTFLDELLVYAPPFAVVGPGLIIAALITTCGQVWIHRNSMEQKKKTENHAKTNEYVTETAKYWQNYLANNSSLLHLEKDTQYHDLIQSLPSAAKDELSKKLDEYKKNLDDFNKLELPKLRTEAKKTVKRDLNMFKNVIQPTANSSLENRLYFDYVRASKDEAREELEKPLRAFLAEELAKLKSRNQFQ